MNPNKLIQLSYPYVLMAYMFVLPSLLKGQSARGFYVGYQTASIMGGMNNLRAFVGSENELYDNVTQEMKYRNILHGISVGYVMRKKASLYQTSFSKKPFFEINWNNLHNNYIAKGSRALPTQGDYTSQYKVRINGLALLIGWQVQKKGTLKFGFQPCKFSIRYKMAQSQNFSNTEFKHITDPEGFPEFLFHFNYDYALSNKLYFRTFLNIPIDLEKELGYYYNTRSLGFQLYYNLGKK